MSTLLLAAPLLTRKPGRQPSCYQSLPPWQHRLTAAVNTLQCIHCPQADASAVEAPSLSFSARPPAALPSMHAPQRHRTPPPLPPHPPSWQGYTSLASHEPLLQVCPPTHRREPRHGSSSAFSLLCRGRAGPLNPPPDHHSPCFSPPLPSPPLPSLPTPPPVLNFLHCHSVGPHSLAGVLCSPPTTDASCGDALRPRFPRTRIFASPPPPPPRMRSYPFPPHTCSPSSPTCMGFPFPPIRVCSYPCLTRLCSILLLYLTV